MNNSLTAHTYMAIRRLDLNCFPNIPIITWAIIRFG